LSTAVNTLSNLYPEAAASLYETPTGSQQADTPMPIRFTNVDTIMAAAGSAPEIPQSITEITQLLRQRHRTKDGDPEDFQIRDMTEISKVFSSTSDRMTSLLLYVALISLIVGGVGIMNIMLVSVTERTKEIGLRMAVGARDLDILEQFLIEAVLLCILGGIVGILMGEFSSWFVRRFAGLPTLTSVWAIVISFIVSAVVGIVFGFYPAWKASRLDPIDALRYE
jgi:ABC-type antimicrobial peptide transport system permease subunit